MVDLLILMKEEFLLNKSSKSFKFLGVVNTSLWMVVIVEYLPSPSMHKIFWVLINLTLSPIWMAIILSFSLDSRWCNKLII